MADIIRFQLRRDTSANWALHNPVLADGEPGYERGTGRGKLGDGVTAWNDLPYNTAGWQGVLDAIDAREGALESAASAAADASLAQLYRGDAETARTAAETARTGAQTARSGAETARSGAETALAGATTAREGAEAARDAAGSFHSTTVQTGTVVNGELILRRNDNSTVNAGNVRGPALVGVVVDTVTGPETPGATGAQGLKGDKGDPGGWTITAIAAATDLNNLITPGIYSQVTPSQATLALNYPVDAANGFLEVYALNPTAVVQKYQPFGSAAVNVRGFYQRRLNGTTWDPWRAYGFQRVDQTAGRAIYTWDDANSREQLIYGDTGSRDISALIDTSKVSVTVAKVRRVGSQVELRLILTALSGVNGSTSLFLSGLPTGFRNQHSVGFTSLVSGTPTGTTLAFNATQLSLGLTAFSSVNVHLSWQTYDPWPTTLPGVADGNVLNT